MIEKYLIKSNQTLKKWRKFKSNRKSFIASWIFLCILFLSLTAEFWSNNKPIVMSYDHKIYFPIFVNYHPSDLDLQSYSSVIEYRKLPSSLLNWSFWPLIKWDPFESNKKPDNYPSPPSFENWFGTDDRGRDVLSRLVYGFRYSIGFAIAVWLLSYFVGTLIGGAMGFLGGWVDLVGQRFVEVIETIPFLLLLITLVDLMGGASFWLLVVFMSIFRWINISYYMRGEFLKIRKREFVDACYVQGMKRSRIMFKHILPNALNPLVTFSPFSMSASISFLAILDYLGFGLTPPTPSWGELLLQAEQYFTVAWWLALFPSIALFLTLMNLTFIGDGIRNAFDPRKTI